MKAVWEVAVAATTLMVAVGVNLTLELRYGWVCLFSTYLRVGYRFGYLL